MKRNLSLSTRVAVSMFAFIAAACLAVWLLGTSHELMAGRHDQLGLVFVSVAVFVIAYAAGRASFVTLSWKQGPLALHCEGCGYRLAGNDTDTCPECGRTVQVRELIKQASHCQAILEAPGERASPLRNRIVLLAGGLLITVIGILVADRWIWPVAGELPDAFERAKRSLVLARWKTGDEMARLDPSSVFVIANGEVQLRLTYNSAIDGDIDSVGIYDRYGRPWLNADVVNNKYDLNTYAAPGPGNDPSTTISDTDGDGIPERRVRWPEGNIEWLAKENNWRSSDSHRE